MTSLKVYLESNVVDRLTARSNSSNDVSLSADNSRYSSNINFGDQASIDISSYLNPPGNQANYLNLSLILQYHQFILLYLF
jgi:hypothetical protein